MAPPAAGEVGVGLGLEVERRRPPDAEGRSGASGNAVREPRSPAAARRMRLGAGQRVVHDRLPDPLERRVAQHPHVAAAHGEDEVARHEPRRPGSARRPDGAAGTRRGSSARPPRSRRPRACPSRRGSGSGPPRTRRSPRPRRPRSGCAPSSRHRACVREYRWGWNTAISRAGPVRASHAQRHRQLDGYVPVVVVEVGAASGASDARTDDGRPSKAASASAAAVGATPTSAAVATAAVAFRRLCAPSTWRRRAASRHRRGRSPHRAPRRARRRRSRASRSLFGSGPVRRRLGMSASRGRRPDAGVVTARDHASRIAS